MLLITMLQVNAVTLAQKVTINVTNAPLVQVFDSIRDQSGVDFFFSASLISKAKPVSVRINEQELGIALAEIFLNQPLTYVIKNNAVQVRIKEQNAADNIGRISGKVMDDRGEPLPGATIKIIQTGQTIQSSPDGTYRFSVNPGIYTLEVTYVSFQTRRITDVTVTANELTTLNITLNAVINSLNQIVVTSGYKKGSVAGHYSQQKNAAAVTNGISSEQISATPDRHVGETLSRISGVSTTDGSKVVVRGIAERYNVATLNGSILPSTDVQERNFEFDLIPSNMVENIVVSKSVTADMPYGFAGGAVQVNTKAIPSENFMSFSAGLGYNSRTMGKDFLGYGRGKYDYFGFDDGSRDHFPKDILNIESGFKPNQPDDQNEVSLAEVADQNKRIGGTERLGTRSYQAAPAQNYQFSLGRVYSLSKNKTRNFGFVSSVNYRNTQRNNYIRNMRRGSWSLRPTNGDDLDDVNTGNLYNFNTNLGALLNAGFSTDKHQIQTQNIYNRVFDNQFSRITGWSWEQPKSPDNPFPEVEEDERPKFTDLLQNRISGKHVFGRFTIDWNASRTHLKQVEQDAISGGLGNTVYANYAPLYHYYPGQASDPGWGNLNRGQFSYREADKEAMFNAAYNFRLGSTNHIFKTGYNYLHRHLFYDWLVLPIVVGDVFRSSYAEIPVQEWGDHMDMKNPMTSFYYKTSKYLDAGFEGKGITHGSYVMTDSKIGAMLRVIWGVRAEHFELDTIKNPTSLMTDDNVKLLLEEEKAWRFLPSASATFSPIADLNLRVAYAKSAVRPGLMENSRFSRYNPNYGTRVRSQGVTTSIIDNYDLKAEWFPKAGEVISAGYFYKKFDKPAEFYRINDESGGSAYVTIGNSDWAKVKGWEFEIRKSLDFILPGALFMNNIFLTGNLTLQKSEVRSREIRYAKGSDGNDSTYFNYLKHPRQLYGQVPLLYNLGAQYTGKRFGINLVYNYMGYKTFVTSSEPMLAEYERPRAQLDMQLSYRFFGNKMQARLNVRNLTDAPYRFFVNDASTYEQKPGTEDLLNAEWGDRYEYKSGFSEKFEKGYTDKETGQLIGDRETFTNYVGRTTSLSLTYNF